MSVFKQNNKYWVSIWHNRIRYRKVSPDNTCAGARAYEALIRQKLSRGEDVNGSKNEIKIPVFSVFAEEWQKTYVLNNNKPSEQLQKDCMLRKHLIPFFGKLPLDKINTFKVEEFKSQKLSKGLSAKSVNNLLGILGKCLRTAQDWEIMDRVPKMKPLKVSPKEIKYLNEDEYNKLLAKANDGGLFYEMLLFSLRTGVRIGELLALEWKDINVINGTVTIRQNIVNGIIGSPKNNKFRTIHLACDILGCLLARKENSGLVFPNDSGDYYSRFICRDRLNALCARAGVKRISWHALRHSFASQLATNGVSLKTIQELLGHSDLKMVQRYAHLEPVTLREAIKTLEPKRDISLDFGHDLDTIPERELVRSSVGTLETSKNAHK